MTRVLFVEDDQYWAQRYVRCLTLSGFTTEYASSVDEVITAIGKHDFDYVVMDIMMDPGELFSDEETCEGFATGLHLARFIRAECPETQVIALSNILGDYISLLVEGTFRRILKKSEVSEAKLVDVLKSLGDWRPECLPHRAFIVHGHDKQFLLETRDYLQNTLGMKEPMVLRNLPSRGKTIIEKFEHYAEQADVVFVLISPDDVAVSRDKTKAKTTKSRARQNVVFELGYFLGRLGRKSGCYSYFTKVILSFLRILTELFTLTYQTELNTRARKSGGNSYYLEHKNRTNGWRGTRYTRPSSIALYEHKFKV